MKAYYYQNHVYISKPLNAWALDSSWFDNHNENYSLKNI